MESRIKMLREKRGLIQELLAVEIGVTQQMLSKYEKDITIIKVDVLKRIAEYFNVTTDYLLGLSDMKRDLSGQIKMNETLDEYYDLIEVYRRMDGYDREMVFGTVDQVVCFVKIFIRLNLSVWCYSGCFFCKFCHNVSYSSLS